MTLLPGAAVFGAFSVFDVDQCVDVYNQIRTSLSP